MSADNGIDTPQKLAPTAFAQQIASALATRHTDRAQVVKIGSPSTGTLAGKMLLSEVALPRGEDETQKDWLLRLRIVAEDALKVCLVLNDENYRDELLRSALADIRGGES